jgi:membrane protein YqaA with SNARE-associated domain
MWQMIAGMSCLVIASAFVGYLSHDTIEVWATSFVSQHGLWGILAATCIADTFFLFQEPILLVGWTGGLGFWPTVAAASVGSILGGMNGWFLGRILGNTSWIKRKISSTSVDAFMRKYGGWAVAVAALTPFPYGVATWASGATRVPFLHVLAGSLLRFPKVLIYLWMLALGWNLASGSLMGLGTD